MRASKIKAEEGKAQAGSAMALTARELLMDGFLNGTECVISEGLFNCTLCKYCSNICPVDIDLTGHLQKLRESCQKDDLFSTPHKRIRNNILELGNAYGSDYTIKSSNTTRGRK